MWRRIADRFNHEYWPWWLIYLPVFPFYLYQAIRQRNAAFFTNVNPAIDLGGFFGESKWAIYELLPRMSYPSTFRIYSNGTTESVLHTHSTSGLSFPLIIKPDMGERGDGVHRIANASELLRIAVGQPQTLLMQGLAHGELEFGLMFAKDPSTGRTELLSVCGKRFLRVAGDGKQSVRELLAKTWRGAKQLQRLEGLKPALLDRIPQVGEEVMVESIGNHCRGTIFFDACHLRTPELSAALDQLLHGARGIYYGRLDVRCESEESLRQGRFTIIELNGVTSEPGHIYDPSYSIFHAWAELLRHLRVIGPISLQLQREGHVPVTFHQLVVRCEAYFGWRLGPLRRAASALEKF